MAQGNPARGQQAYAKALGRQQRSLASNLAKGAAQRQQASLAQAGGRQAVNPIARIGPSSPQYGNLQRLAQARVGGVPVQRGSRLTIRQQRSPNPGGPMRRVGLSKNPGGKMLPPGGRLPVSAREAPRGPGFRPRANSGITIRFGG